TATATATATATPTPTATARRVDAVADADDSSFTSACDTLPAADLLSLADASRYARNFARAEQALRATRRRFPGTDAAAAAAFGLGRIAFDARRDFAAAGDAFDVYLHERPNGPLAREALGRALEARTNAGDTARAQALAARYLADFPDGPHAQLARRVGGAR
ncbi:MAG TPA: tetratricopeptide repeat protein, partial [Labilithrix sp.]